MKDPTTGTGKTAHRTGGHQVKVLLLGSTGFIGSRIAASLLHTGETLLTVLSRNPAGHPPAPHGITVPGDLRDPSSLAAAVEGMDVVVHAASYVGPDPQIADAVNRQGTADLLAACERQGVGRVVYLSTTSVYGSGPHRGLVERDGVYAPRSAVSAARAEADRMVLEAGGTVIRPNLVFGRGDRWFIPGLARMMRIGTWPGEEPAALSIIGVETLGEMIARVALSSVHQGTAFHAVGPRPVPVPELLRETARQLGIPVPGFGPGTEVRDRFQAAGFTGHQTDLVTQDHWYSGAALRDAVGRKIDSGSLPSPAEWAWYLEKITGR